MNTHYLFCVHMTIQRYHPVLIFFHWFIFLLVVLALASIELKAQFIKGSPPRELCKTIHGYLGQLILISVVLRLFAKYYFGNPPSISANRVMTLLRKVMHTLLYCLLLTLPILGVIFLQAGNKPVDWLGWELPNLIQGNPAVKKSFKAAHEWLGNALYYVIGLHAFSAIWQHFVLKNDTLQRMLYRRSSLSE